MSLSSSQSWSCVQVSGENPGDNYSVYQHGRHTHGNFIRVYVPEAAASSGTELKAILYLHGFALCMPEFYEAHLVDLVKKGYIVFFPDFQHSFYPNTQPQQPIPPRKSLAHLRTWWSVATQLAQRPAEESLSTDDVNSMLWGIRDPCEPDDEELGSELSQFNVRELRAVARALVVIIPLLTVLCRKHLIHLLSTVGLSLGSRPITQWLPKAIGLTEDAWKYLSEQDRYSHWNQEKLETFAFGHSLGGLIALSLPYALKNHSDNRFYPKQIVTADPAPSTEMGIPKFAILILKLFGAPFTADPILIQKTGPSLTVPVAILHGASDKMVPPHQWVAANGKCSNYKAIASQEKAIYFSYSNPKAKVKPPLVAFHNQAVTCTEYYGDGLFKGFGGVKKGPNAYNNDYVWPGVDKIFNGNATPKDLLSHLNTPNFEVKTTPPAAPSKLIKTLVWILVIILLFVAWYWVWGKAGYI